ncbi:WD40 domain-containing protein [Ancylothrix sp. C2]|uniref:WD40 repeat domain-containing protein n=1 Tax=Ancylothrix sp. D3o TaxID=2953691 RepID=UPI0021BA49A6|nr:WD40 repeat domain-containing protein [Ancylothrix sp. D3o]MCT7950366.1 WD40 domain-containing protein [Ancylothrix sp. D3o]
MKHYLRSTASSLWQILAEIFDTPINKANFRTILEARSLSAEERELIEKFIRSQHRLTPQEFPDSPVPITSSFYIKRPPKELTVLRGQTAAIRGLAYSQDGKFVASVSEDHRLILWNVQEVFNLDLFVYGCHWLRDYLRTNSLKEESNQHLCEGVNGRSKK